jgi:hypothetical protein
VPVQHRARVLVALADLGVHALRVRDVLRVGALVRDAPPDLVGQLLGASERKEELGVRLG